MSDYDLHALNLPKLAGRTLAAFAGALANPVTRAALMPNLLKQGGFDRFHALRLEEPPTFYPLVAAAAPATEPLAPAAVTEALGPYTAGAVFTTARDVAPVSYTHLDVYKRQDWSSWACGTKHPRRCA